MKPRLATISLSLALGLIAHAGNARAQDASATSSPPPSAAAPARAVPTASATSPTSSAAQEPDAAIEPVEEISPSRSLPVAGGTVPIPLPLTRGGRALDWDPEWRKFDAWDYSLTGAAAATALVTAIVKPLPAGIHGPLLFDNDARKLRLDSYNKQRTARDVSDVLLSLSFTGPFLVDSMIVAYWYRGNKAVAQEMALIDMETFAVTAAVQGLVSMAAGRARPFVGTCGGSLPSNSLDCDSFGKDRSFFSGHTSLSFAGASLVCTHHQNLKLFDNPTTDALSCVTSYAAATATGVLRIVGDQHYATDVITGAVVGTTIGLALPYLLHYRRSSSGTKKTSDFHLQLMPTFNGGAAVGTF